MAALRETLIFDFAGVLRMLGNIMEAVSVKNAEHYVWGDGCDGWHLLKLSGVSVIQEKAPAGKSEIRHRHNKSEQFFYVLHGEATIEAGENRTILRAGEGLHIPPRVAHQFKNESGRDVEFLVVSTPPSHDDRENI